MLKAKNSQKVLKFFCVISKIFGFTVFAYPFKQYKLSKYGKVSGLINFLIWVLLSLYFIRQLFDRPKDSKSEVFEFGIILIRGMIPLLILSCLVINFIQRKSIFKLFQLFEKLDDVVSDQ